MAALGLLLQSDFETLACMSMPQVEILQKWQGSLLLALKSSLSMY
jgi:hypothetical protein